MVNMYRNTSTCWLFQSVPESVGTIVHCIVASVRGKYDTALLCASHYRTFMRTMCVFRKHTFSKIHFWQIYIFACERSSHNPVTSHRICQTLIGKRIDWKINLNSVRSSVKWHDDTLSIGYSETKWISRFCQSDNLHIERSGYIYRYR